MKAACELSNPVLRITALKFRVVFRFFMRFIVRLAAFNLVAVDDEDCGFPVRLRGAYPQCLR